MQKITICKHLDDTSIYAVYDRNSKYYVKSTNKEAENGVIVLIRSEDTE